MSSKKKKIKDIKDEKRELYNQAAEAFLSRIVSIHDSLCWPLQGQSHNLERLSQIQERICCGGRKGSAFAADEEKKLVNFVSDQLSVGCGIDFKQLSMVKKGEKRKREDGSDLPQVEAPVVAPAGVSVPAQTPARKRGRPKKNLPDDQLDQSKSLDDMFAKKKR